MDGENIISWNFANWITVLIMCMAGFALYGLVGRLVYGKSGANSNDPASATTV